MNSIDNQRNIAEQKADSDDYALIESFIGGSDHAFTRLVAKHKDKVRNLVYLTLGDIENIDDISQDVFIAVYRNIGEFRFDSKFTTWLYRITVNKCRDFLRKKKVRSIFINMGEDDYEQGYNDRAENYDIPGLVRKGIEKLPDKLKEPLMMRDIEGLSYKEIADKLDCEVGTIKSRIFRARETLKVILLPYQKDLGF